MVEVPAVLNCAISPAPIPAMAVDHAPALQFPLVEVVVKVVFAAMADCVANGAMAATTAAVGIATDDVEILLAT
jgi:hypothetical protein